MDVQDVLFLVFWLLPGMVIGMVFTMATQHLVRQPASKKELGKSKKDDDAGKTILEDDMTYLPKVIYVSASGRAHKTPRCSNMKDVQRVELCGKCFKRA